jgi:hypothetical protein
VTSGGAQQLPARLAGPDWHTWAPPLDPPTAGGLPLAEAEEIIAAYWADDPHEAAMIMWENYAATLPPTPVVAQVATGSQSVSYSPPMPGGDYGLALGRAAWHRSFLGTLRTAPLKVGPLPDPLPVDWWQRNLEDPP